MYLSSFLFSFYILHSNVTNCFKSNQRQKGWINTFAPLYIDFNTEMKTGYILFILFEYFA